MRSRTTALLLLGLLLSLAPAPTGAAHHRGADLAITKTGPTEVTTTDTLLYLLTATNNGPHAVGRVVVRDVFPHSDLAFLPALSDPLCKERISSGGEKRVRCGEFTLKAGKTKELRIAFSPTHLPCNVDIVNQASVHTNAPQRDPNKANNVSSAVTTTITCPSSTGNLYVTLDSTPTRSHQLLGGALGDAVLRLVFRAEHESIDVTTLRFDSTDDDRAVERLVLFLAGEETPFATATGGACTLGPRPGGDFCVHMESQQLLIEENETVDVLVRPRLKTDEERNRSGYIVRIILDADDANSPHDHVNARGVSSSNALQRNDHDDIAEGEIFIGTASAGRGSEIASLIHEVVMAKIASIENANPDPNGTNVPVGTNKRIAEFRFTAAPHANTENGLNDLVLDGVMFNTSAVNVELAASDFRLLNKEDLTMAAPCTPMDADGNALTGTVSGPFFVSCSSLAAGSVNTEIDQGTSATFVLQGNVTNPQVSSTLDSLLQVSFLQFDSILASSFGPSGSHVRWLDRDSGDATAFLWMEHDTPVVSSTLYSS